MQKFTTALKNNGTLRKVNWTNEWIVEDPFVWYIDYLDHSKWEIVIQKGYKTDFWTIPRILRPIFNPTAHLAYVLHDYVYEYKTYSRKDSDLIMAQALIAEWMNRIGVFFVWIGVRLFGWIYY